MADRQQIEHRIVEGKPRGDACDLIEMKDGKIASFIAFCDTAAAARLMVRG